MRRLIAANLVPERAGQPVKAWLYISLADLLLLDADSALQHQWTGRSGPGGPPAGRTPPRPARPTGRGWTGTPRRHPSTPRWPHRHGDINVHALDDFVRLCVELDRPTRRRPPPGTPAAWAALEQAVIGKAVDLLSGPGGLASFLRRRQLGVRLGGPSLPLDIGVLRNDPGRDPQRGPAVGPAPPVGRRLHPARRRL